MAKHNKVGKWGEELACDTLLAQGYAILEKNWKMDHFEIDIVAMKGERIIFVEVKTRTKIEDDPVLAVTRPKIRRTIAAATAYVKTHDIKHEIQFDIIAITGTVDDYRIEHIPDAFMPILKTYR